MQQNMWIGSIAIRNPDAEKYDHLLKGVSFERIATYLQCSVCYVVQTSFAASSPDRIMAVVPKHICFVQP